jgi:tetratricopeptide (TPR) repeat protein
MQGDVEQADQIFQQYMRFREEVYDPLISFRAASWQYQIGRRKEAVASLTTILEEDDLQPAWVPGMRSQLAMWALLAGNREEAVRQADLALRATGGRVADGALLAVKFLSQPAAGPEEWRARAERMFTGGAQNRLMQELLLYAHLLSDHFEEALPLAENLYREAAPFAEGELQVLLAWALLKTGEIERAGELLRPNPVIQPETESPAFSLVFPRILYLRGLVADHAGEREEAVRNMELFLKYSGDLPGTFGEEENARTVVTAYRR